MNQGSFQTNPRRKAAAAKFILLIFFALLAIYVVRFTPVKNVLTHEELNRLLDLTGIWAPVAYILIFALAVCLFVPGSLVTVLGGAIFGPYYGLLYVWVGAMIGASTAFWIGRTLGREFTEMRIGNRLKKYDEAIERNGFTTVLYLRLIYFPFTLLNFGMGLTKVRFRDYFWGTGLGIIIGVFIITFFVGILKEVWMSGHWENLLTGKVFFSLVLFILSFFIPKIIKKIKRED